MFRGKLLPAAVSVCALLLASCATIDQSPKPTQSIAPGAAFEIVGRISARHASEAAAANFRWMHSFDRDELEFTSPLGQTIARMDGDSRGARLLAADGSAISAENWSALTERALHFPLPVEGLASWIQGLPRAGSMHTSEAGAGGLPAVLRQDGWEIVYQAYGTAGRRSYAADAYRAQLSRSGSAHRDRRMAMTCPVNAGVEIAWGSTRDLMCR